MADEQFLFHEIYSTYFNTITKIINKAISGELSKEEYNNILSTVLYDDFPYLLDKNVIANNYKGVIDKNHNTLLRNKIERPFTILERRWLKTIAMDERVQLFDFDFSFVENELPLYSKEDIQYIGGYTHGDPYSNPRYRSIFKCILAALKEKLYLKVHYNSRREGEALIEVEPQRLEYSVKEDMFRLICVHNGNRRELTLSRIIECESFGIRKEPTQNLSLEKEYVEVLLKDERKALERFMLYFATYEKETKQIKDDVYSVKIYFNINEETEVLINLLSFVPMLKVVSPEHIKHRFLDRIKKQKELFLKMQ